MNYPILFSVGNLHFYTHGLFIMLGILAGVLVVDRLARAENLENKNFFDYLVYILLAGIIGARLTYGVLYFQQFRSWWEVFALWQGGMVSYGGFFFGALTMLYLFRRNRKELNEWLDLTAIGLMLGIALGRIGCFLNGDAGGIASKSLLAVRGFLPTQLWESGWAFVLALGGYFLWQKTRQSGIVFYLVLAFYGLGRIGIDFFREEKIIFLLLKSGQIAGIILFIIGLTGFLIKIQSKEKK